MTRSIPSWREIPSGHSPEEAPPLLLWIKFWMAVSRRSRAIQGGLSSPEKISVCRKAGRRGNKFWIFQFIVLTVLSLGNSLSLPGSSLGARVPEALPPLAVSIAYPVQPLNVYQESGLSGAGCRVGWVPRKKWEVLTAGAENAKGAWKTNRTRINAETARMNTDLTGNDP